MNKPTLVMFDCNLAHRRSVAELCMLFKIKSNPVHPSSSALPLPYVPVRVTLGALVAHRHSFTPPRCKTSQYRRSFVPLLMSLWNDFVTLCLLVWDWRVSRAEPMLSCWHDLLFIFCCLLFYLFVVSTCWLCGVGVFRLIVFSLSSGLAQRSPINNNNNIHTEWNLFLFPRRICYVGPEASLIRFYF